MRLAVLATLATLACNATDVDPLKSVLETSQTSYVAVDDPSPTFDHSVTVIVTLRNTSDLIVRLSGCTVASDEPPYSVEKRGSGVAAWSPVLSCAPFGTPSRDLAPGQQLTDTLVLRAPWQRTVTGQPIGDFDGTFNLILETQICASVTTNGLCNPIARWEYVPSNQFTITR